MKKRTFIFGIILFIMTACSLFENKEKKAIEICKMTKVQFSSEDNNAFANLLLNSIGGYALGLNRNATWQDFANMLAEREPNKKFEWEANKTEEEGIYLVSFRDEEGWGHRWEVALETQTVKFIALNEYLCRKYGLSRFDADENFKIVNITTNTMKIENVYSYYSNSYVKNIVYIFKASVINKTNKTLTDAKISGELKAVYKDKTIIGDDDWRNSGFKSKVSKNKPWLPNTEREFYIKTKGIEEIYLNYTPEYVFLEINLIAEDPIGFSYNKNIAEFDLKDKWEKIK